MTHYVPTQLLRSGSSSKAVKASKYKTMNAILYLKPSASACPNQGIAGCGNTCLYTAGRGAMKLVQKARVNRTKYLLENPDGFKAQLNHDIGKLVAKAKRDGVKLVVRLNGTSDYDWREIYLANPKVQFVEYTKVIRPDLLMIKNLHVTFSYSGKKEFLPLVIKAIDNGYNIATVFSRILPSNFFGLPVIDGDLHDLRNLDKKHKKQVVVGLLAKGKARHSKADFIVDSNIIAMAA